MKVIATELGFVLSFESIEDMATVTEHLQGQLEWIKTTNANSPYLYMVYSSNASMGEISKLLQKLKQQFAK